MEGMYTIGKYIEIGADIDRYLSVLEIGLLKPCFIEPSINTDDTIRMHRSCGDHAKEYWS